MKIKLTLTLILALFVLAACSSTPVIHTDYDRSANFADYKTYGFFDNQATDKAQYSTLTTQYFKDSLRLEMNKRGYIYTEAKPDLLVNFNAKLTDKVKVTNSPSVGVGVGMGHPGYYGYRGGHYAAWGSYNFNTTNVSQYTEGTVNVDLVDPRMKQLVWEGVVVGRVNEKKMADLENAIGRVVGEIMATYPFTAGNATPKVIEK